MAEPDSRKGRLVSVAADSSEYMVDFVLDVEIEVVRESQRFSPSNVMRRYRLQVKEEAIPDGEYTLKRRTKYSPFARPDAHGKSSTKW